MDQRDAFWEISETLKKIGFSKITTNPNIAFSGQIQFGHKKASITLEIPDLNFVRLPQVRFTDQDLPLEIIAHLETNTGICYADKQFLRLDPSLPGASILRVLKEVQITLESSLAGNANKEISAEFTAYWKGLSVGVLDDFNSKKEIAFFSSIKNSNNGPIFLLTKAKNRTPKSHKFLSKVEIYTPTCNANTAEKFITPRTLKNLFDWWEFQAFKNEFSLVNIIEKLANKEIVFINADNGCLGFEVEFTPYMKTLSKKSNRPIAMKKYLIEHSDMIILRKYYGQNVSQKFVTTRNIMKENHVLADKNIVLIGCGTIGSHLARYLVQSGAGTNKPLVLIDNDILAPGNIGRHLLNFSDIGAPKATAVAKEISKFHPDVKIEAKDVNVLDAFSTISKADLVIDATGVEIVSEFLNSHIKKLGSKGKCPALLHVFLWNNGIAAQTFLMDGEDFACYRCLRPDLKTKQWRFDPRKDVSSSGKIIPANCGDGPYLPYSLISSVSAATLALGAVIDYFSGSTGHRLRNLIFDRTEARIVKDQSPKVSSKCPVCST